MHRQQMMDLANKNRPIDFFVVFQHLVNDVLKSGAIDVVFMMYKVRWDGFLIIKMRFVCSKDPRIRCVKQKCLDLLSNIATIPEGAQMILERYSIFLNQLVQGIRDGHLIEEKIPSLSVLLRLCKIIVEKNLLGSYQHLIDMQLIDIIIDLCENCEYQYIDSIIYFIKFESLALQCLHIMLQSAEHVDMWSESTCEKDHRSI